MAKDTGDPAGKATWSRMAERWLRCAERSNSPSVAAPMTASVATPHRVSAHISTFCAPQPSAIGRACSHVFIGGSLSAPGQRIRVARAEATDPSLKSTFAELAKGYVRLELAEQKQT